MSENVSVQGRATTSAPVAIEIDGVTRRYGDLIALENISLQIFAQQVTCIVGPSGCGKSTLLDLISGLQQPQTGTVRHDGAQISGANPNAAMVFQRPALYPWLTVSKNVTLGLSVRKVERREAHERANEVLASVGLEGFEDSYPHQLSGGMAQRVGIARALVLRPSVLLMDEPFAAVDAYTRLKLQDELRTIIAGHPTTVVFVTHDIGESVLMGDRVAVMSPRPGRLITVLDVPDAAKSHTSTEHGELTSQILELLQQT